MKSIKSVFILVLFSFCCQAQELQPLSVSPKNLVPGMVNTNPTVHLENFSLERLPDKFKRAVFIYHGIPYDQRTNYEMNCLIPLKLGGECGSVNIMLIPKEHAQKKRDLDAFMVQRIQAITATNTAMAEAELKSFQREVCTNWVDAHRRHVLNLGATNFPEAEILMK